jgi:hypothetical protein
MDKQIAGGDNASSPQPKRGLWRFFLWGIGLGGGGLLLFGIFLVSITIPNLRREVAPPEVSGPEQTQRNAAQSPVSPTSRTLTVSSPTSGTQPLLNLDDFPHLSPRMRELAQSWLDRCSETDKALDSIADPVLRVQALALLDRKKAKMWLNFPLEWGNRTFQEEKQRLLRLREQYSQNVPLWRPLYVSDETEEGLHFRPGAEFLKECSEFSTALEKEDFRFFVLTKRIDFEFFIYSHDWDTAADSCSISAIMSLSRWDYADSSVRGEWREINTWDEELYCRRQMGMQGLLGLARRSYQHALDTQMNGRYSRPLYGWIRNPNDRTVWEGTVNFLKKRPIGQSPGSSNE